MRRTFEQSKETKGTFQYKEVEEADGPTMCGTIYLRKDALKATTEFGAPGEIPQSITVTVEVPAE